MTKVHHSKGRSWAFVLLLTALGATMAIAPSAGGQGEPRAAAVSSDGATMEMSGFTERAASPWGGGSAPSGTVSGEANAETLISPDRRTLISPTTGYPNRAVALITINGATQTHHCTAWFVGPDTVATAGHCVERGASGSWYTGVRVYPGRNGSTSPYGYCTGELWSNTFWTNNSNEEYDYGAIDLDACVGGPSGTSTGNMGNAVGWFGYWWQSASLNGFVNNTQGYPGDKPKTQWRATNCATNTTSFVQCTISGTSTRQLFYRNDTVGGQSGSPLWQNRASGAAFCGGGPCAMGIHAYGFPHSSGMHQTHNHGTRITQGVYDFIGRIKALT